jgi:hypothetical protein
MSKDLLDAILIQAEVDDFREKEKIYGTFDLVKKGPTKRRCLRHYFL